VRVPLSRARCRPSFRGWKFATQSGMECVWCVYLTSVARTRSSCHKLRSPKGYGSRRRSSFEQGVQMGNLNSGGERACQIRRKISSETKFETQTSSPNSQVGHLGVGGAKRMRVAVEVKRPRQSGSLRGKKSTYHPSDAEPLHKWGAF